MFRENVLIALTILVTILSLSFVILLTVYMHIHETERAVKRTEMQPQEIKIQNGEELIKNDPLLNYIIEIAKENENSAHGFQRNIPSFNEPVPDNEPPASSATTEDSIDEGFYTNDNTYQNYRLPLPPAGSRVIPYKLYNKNGHLTLEMPIEINLKKDMDQVKKVLDQLNEFYREEKFREAEERALAMDGYGIWPRPTLKTQVGQIWIRNHPTPNTTNPKASNAHSDSGGKEPFDDTDIFDTVLMNRFKKMGLDSDMIRQMHYKKRKKRSLRKMPSRHSMQVAKGPRIAL